MSTLAQDTPKERNRKMLMFWMIYIMDRNTSLRVGRTPCVSGFGCSLGTDVSMASARHSFLESSIPRKLLLADVFETA